MIAPRPGTVYDRCMKRLRLRRYALLLAGCMLAFAVSPFPDTTAMAQDLKSELAPTGALRAGINMSNFLLVTGRTASGDPDGVSPDMARAIAEKLGVPVKLVPFK